MEPHDAKAVKGEGVQKAVQPSNEMPKGRASALGILRYITWTGKDHKRKRANNAAMHQKLRYSQRPRDPKMRKLLAQLGTMDKDEIKIYAATTTHESYWEPLEDGLKGMPLPEYIEGIAKGTLISINGKYFVQKTEKINE